MEEFRAHACWYCVMVGIYLFVLALIGCGRFPFGNPQSSGVPNDGGAQSMPVDGGVSNERCATSWSYPLPLDRYAVGFDAAASFLHPYGHLGDDIRVSAGTEMRAPADGRIVWHGSSLGYGELLVVIEHDLEESYEFPTGDGAPTDTTTVLSIMGNLRRSRTEGGTSLPWSVGSWVTRGATIGFVDSAHGASMSHTHIGFRLASADDAKLRDPDNWFRAYDKTRTYWHDFAAPRTVLDTLIDTPSMCSGK